MFKRSRKSTPKSSGSSLVVRAKSRRIQIGNELYPEYAFAFAEGVVGDRRKEMAEKDLP
jgi:hypothetical protein